MSLMTCPQCGRKRVSDKAYACPACGFRIREYLQSSKCQQIIDEKEKLYTDYSRAIAMNSVQVSQLRKMPAQSQKPSLGLIAAFIIILLLLFGYANYTPSNPMRENPEYRRQIESYEEKHKDDWKGYKGYRKGSPAETQKLKQDGYDPDDYRKTMGY